MSIDCSIVPLIWDEGELPPAERREEIEAAVRADLAIDIGEDLEAPADLVFHHVFLADEHDGPTVFVYGKEGSEAFHCCYVEKMEWRPMSEAQ